MNAWFVVWVSVIGFGLLVGLVFFVIALVLERRDKRRRREAIRRVQRFKGRPPAAARLRPGARKS